MELTLNLVWVCVAIAGILVQIVMESRAAKRCERRGSQWRKVVAMSCALVILFFVISMTDDLHDQALLFEESKLSRIAAGARSSTHSASDRSVSLDFLHYVPVAPFSTPSPIVSRLVTPSKSPFMTALEWESLSGRAPPAVLA